MAKPISIQNEMYSSSMFFRISNMIMYSTNNNTKLLHSLTMRIVEITNSDLVIIQCTLCTQRIDSAVMIIQISSVITLLTPKKISHTT